MEEAISTTCGRTCEQKKQARASVSSQNKPGPILAAETGAVNLEL